jgi:transcriptional regulator with GAF, ATPase, and Fis domain
VETDEVLGTVLLLRDVLARALFLRHQGDPELLGGVLDVYEPAANRIAVTVGVSFVEERERVIREQQAAIRERAEMLHRLSTFLADASLALDAPGSLEEVLQLVAEHARELVAAERCRAEIRLPDGLMIERHAGAEPGTEPASVPPADVAALYAAVAPGRRSLRMSSAELAAEPARSALEGAGQRVRSMRSWLVASLSAPDGNEVGLIQAFDKREGEFTHLDEEVLVQLAQMAAAAVERAQRYAHGPRS